MGLFLSLKALANLSDPIAVPLPTSTRSMPLSLLSATDGCWEPHFRLPLQNSGIWTKCWLSTIGRSSVQPIFLPVIRHAVRGDTLMPWAQVQLFARGIVELAYFWSALPLAVFGRTRGPAKVGPRRVICLVLRSLLPMLGMAWTHVVMSTWTLAFFANFIMLMYYLMWTNFELHPWPIALSATATMVGIAVYPMLLTARAALLKQLGFPATPVPSGRRWFRCTPRCNPSSLALLHWIGLLLQGFLAEPAFLIWSP